MPKISKIQVGNSTYDIFKNAQIVQSSPAGNPWYKVADCAVTADYVDASISFKVLGLYQEKLTGSTLGVLHCHFRTGAKGVFQYGKLVWEYAGNTVKPEDFVLAYKANSGVDISIELWCKNAGANDGYLFEVLDETNRKMTDKTRYWNLYNTNGAGQADITDGYTQIQSTVMALQNPVASASKLATPRKISGVEFDGSKDITLNASDVGAKAVRRASSIRSDGAAVNPWYKIADCSIADANVDINISFKVSAVFGEETGTQLGILNCHIRTSSVGIIGQLGVQKLVWEYAGDGINTDNFVLAYKENPGTSVSAELWCKVDKGMCGYLFEVINEGRRSSKTLDWKLYQSYTAGQAAGITDGYTQIKSTLMILQNQATDSTKLPLAGGTMTGDITRSFPTYEFKPITCYEGNPSGAGIVMQSGGRIIIGSGESGEGLRKEIGNKATDEAAEETYIASDNNIHLVAACQHLPNRKEVLIDITGSIITPGSVYLDATENGVHLKDSTGYSYPGMIDNGSDLYIGASSSDSKHHTGQTVISTGYDTDSSTGNSTIFVSVPNADNDNATNYQVVHENNIQSIVNNENVTAPLASKLATARTINGVEFDGSQNISIPMMTMFTDVITLKETDSDTAPSVTQPCWYIKKDNIVILYISTGYVQPNDAGPAWITDVIYLPEALWGYKKSYPGWAVIESAGSMDNVNRVLCGALNHTSVSNADKRIVIGSGSFVGNVTPTKLGVMNASSGYCILEY